MNDDTLQNNDLEESLGDFGVQVTTTNNDDDTDVNAASVSDELKDMGIEIDEGDDAVEIDSFDDRDEF